MGENISSTRRNLFITIYGKSTNIKDAIENTQSNQIINDGLPLSKNVEEVALIVARDGDELESIAKNFYGYNDMEMDFLYDKSGALYKKYRERVRVLRESIEKHNQQKPRTTKTVKKKIIKDNIKDIEQYCWTEVTEWKMEKVIDKTYHENGKIEYLVRWEELDNTWEPADSESIEPSCTDCGVRYHLSFLDREGKKKYQQLILEYEYDYAKTYQINSSNVLKLYTTTRASRINDCTDADDIELVVDAVQLNDELKYLVYKKGTLDTRFISLSEACEKFSQEFLQKFIPLQQ